MFHRRSYSDLVPAAAAEVGLEHGSESQHKPVVRAVASGGRVRRSLFDHGYWHLVPVLARQQLRSRYKQSGLHIAWNVIQPVALVGIYALFFHGVLNIESGDIPYLAFIVTGLVPWRFVSNAMSTSSALSDNMQLISKVYFPREIIPIVNTSIGIVELGIGTLIILAVTAAQGIYPTIHLVTLPLAYLIIIAFGAAVTIFLTALAVFIRDVSYGMQFILLGFFFATPIMYPTSQLPEWLRWFPSINPLAVGIDAVRSATLLNEWPNWGLLTLHTIIALALLVASLSYMRSVEHRMADIA